MFEEFVWPVPLFLFLLQEDEEEFKVSISVFNEVRPVSYLIRCFMYNFIPRGMELQSVPFLCDILRCHYIMSLSISVHVQLTWLIPLYLHDLGMVQGCLQKFLMW